MKVWVCLLCVSIISGVSNEPVAGATSIPSPNLGFMDNDGEKVVPTVLHGFAEVGKEQQDVFSLFLPWRLALLCLLNLVTSLSAVLVRLFLVVQYTTQIACFGIFFSFSVLESCASSFKDTFAKFADFFCDLVLLWWFVMHFWRKQLLCSKCLLKTLN